MGILYNSKYQPAFSPEKSFKEQDWILALAGKKVVMKKDNGKNTIPRAAEIAFIIEDDEATEFIGSYDGHDCYCKQMMDIRELPEGLEYIEIRDITDKSKDPGLFLLVGTASHILHWRSVNQYCGCCGEKNDYKKDERAMICPSCTNTVYPRISPAMITAVYRGDEILLAHNRNFPKSLYSLIAGYVEPGETLEHCVEREIEEEVGIRVKNIRYMCSQPWPFPDSLMTAFTAEYVSGDIRADQYEITDAAWYKAGNLPDIPSTDSIAGKMIRCYLEEYNKSATGIKS